MGWPTTVKKNTTRPMQNDDTVTMGDKGNNGDKRGPLMTLMTKLLMVKTSRITRPFYYVENGLETNMTGLPFFAIVGICNDAE
jgi:hypothetical protein